MKKLCHKLYYLLLSKTIIMIKEGQRNGGYYRMGLLPILQASQKIG
jgi:hypothetical protein